MRIVGDVDDALSPGILDLLRSFESFILFLFVGIVSLTSRSSEFVHVHMRTHFRHGTKLAISTIGKTDFTYVPSLRRFNTIPGTLARSWQFPKIISTQFASS